MSPPSACRNGRTLSSTASTRSLVVHSMPPRRFFVSRNADRDGNSRASPALDGFPPDLRNIDKGIAAGPRGRGLLRSRCGTIRGGSAERARGVGLRNQRRQIVHVERLADDAIDAEIQRGLHDLRCAVSGHQDDPCRRREPPQPGQQRQVVGIGEAEIEQHDIEGHSGGCHGWSTPAASPASTTTCPTRKRLEKRPPDQRLVVDDQDAQQRRRAGEHVVTPSCGSHARSELWLQTRPVSPRHTSTRPRATSSPDPEAEGARLQAHDHGDAGTRRSRPFQMAVRVFHGVNPRIFRHDDPSRSLRRSLRILRSAGLQAADFTAMDVETA